MALSLLGMLVLSSGIWRRSGNIRSLSMCANGACERGRWARTGSEAGSRLHWCGKLFILLLFNPPNLSSAVDVEDAFNVVYLVLEDTRQPPVGF